MRLAGARAIGRRPEYKRSPRRQEKQEQEPRELSGAEDYLAACLVPCSQGWEGVCPSPEEEIRVGFYKLRRVPQKPPPQRQRKKVLPARRIGAL